MFSRFAAAICLAIAIGGCAGEIDQDAAAGDNLDHDRDDDVGVRARVCADGTTTKGIDVSKWQGTIDWARVKNAGIAFAFIRVSDGANSHDSKFASNWANARAAGVIRGAYQFFRPAQSVTAQADLLLDAIGGSYTPGDLPPVIDVESNGGLSPTTVASRVRQWVDRVQAALGVTPIVYTGKYFWRDEVGSPASFESSPLWIAQYTSLCPDLPGPWSKWTFWQYTSSGSVSGIAGHVDTNRFNGTLADLHAFVNATPPSPLAFSWVRNPDATYRFFAEPGDGVARVEFRVGNYYIGTADTPSGSGYVDYTFNYDVPDRTIEARGLAADNTVAALGNGIIDSIADTAVFVRQTDEHEYEIGLERAPASWATLEVVVDGYSLPDLDTGLTRSPRLAVRYEFSGLGDRDLAIRARDADGNIVEGWSRTLDVR